MWNNGIGLALLWDRTQRGMVFPYRRFGTCGFHFKGEASSQYRLFGLIDSLRWKRYAVLKRRYGKKHSTLCKIVEERIPHLRCRRCRKTRMSVLI